MKATIKNYIFDFFKIFGTYLVLVGIYLGILGLLFGLFVLLLIISDFNKSFSVYVKFLENFLDIEFHLGLLLVSFILPILYTVYRFYYIYKYGIKTSDIEISNEKVVNKLNDQLKILDIGGKNLTCFIFTNGKTIKIKSTNLAKICYKTIENHKKNTFLQNELLGEYNYFKENYKTSLDQETYNKVLVIIERFVKEGGIINVL